MKAATVKYNIDENKLQTQFRDYVVKHVLDLHSEEPYTSMIDSRGGPVKYIESLVNHEFNKVLGEIQSDKLVLSTAINTLGRNKVLSNTNIREIVKDNERLVINTYQDRISNCKIKENNSDLPASHKADILTERLRLQFSENYSVNYLKNVQTMRGPSMLKERSSIRSIQKKYEISSNKTLGDYMMHKSDILITHMFLATSKSDLTRIQGALDTAKEKAHEAFNEKIRELMADDVTREMLKDPKFLSKARHLIDKRINSTIPRIHQLYFKAHKENRKAKRADKYIASCKDALKGVADEHEEATRNLYRYQKSFDSTGEQFKEVREEYLEYILANHAIMSVTEPINNLYEPLTEGILGSVEETFELHEVEDHFADDNYEPSLDDNSEYISLENVKASPSHGWVQGNVNVARQKAREAEQDSEASHEGGRHGPGYGSDGGE